MDAQEMDTMEEPPTLDEIYDAISVINNKGSSTNKLQAASQLLENVQKSNFAWKVAEELISRKINHGSCFFAAQTIQSKLINETNEIPPESLKAVRSSLYGYLATLDVNNDDDRVISIQLCVALARVIIELGSWSTATAEVVSRYETMTTVFLVELLSVLSEEVHTRSMRIAVHRCMPLYTEFVRNVPIVNEFLEMCLKTEPNDERLKKVSYKCFANWLNIDCVYSSTVWNSAVLVEVFNMLYTNNCSLEIHGIAADTVIAFISTLTYNFHDQAELHVEVLSSIKKFEKAYAECVTNDDTERCKNYSRIFTDLAEVLNVTAILKTIEDNFEPHYAIKTFDSVLLCSNSDKFEVAQVTFHVWSILAEELNLRRHPQLTELYKHYFDNLLPALYKHCVIDIQTVNLSEDKDDDIAEIRKACSSVIKDISVVGSTSYVFNEMYRKLQMETTTDEAWNQKEAALFVMQAAAKNLSPYENDVMPKVVQAIINMPDTVHINIRYTSVRLLGELGNWIAHGPQTRYLEPVLNYLRYSIQQESLATVIAQTMHNICDSCRLPMVRYINGVVEMLGIVDGLGLSNDVSIGLLKGLAYVVSEIPDAHRYNSVKTLCWRQLSPLLALAEEVDPPANPVANTPADPVFWIQRLLAVLRCLHVKRHRNNDPCVVAVVEVMWPFVSNISERYKTKARITEYICRCIKRMTGLLSNLHKEHMHVCYLYIASNLVEDYAESFQNEVLEAECHLILLKMINSFHEPAIQLMRQEGGLQNHPDFIVGFFRMANRVVGKLPQAFLRSAELEIVVKCGVATLSVHHKYANTAVVKFLVDLFAAGNPRRVDIELDVAARNNIMAMFYAVGEQLIEGLLNMALYNPHERLLPELMEIIMELFCYDGEKAMDWLSNAVVNLPETLPDGRPTADAEQRLTFLTIVYKHEHQIFMCHALRAFRDCFQ
ncbi:transportin-3-like [Adelges cooleyi]|uniref:transportin-3-like n=1 Tax=Adelges cooleyi TaxID=133065 RepID=UPI00217FFB75|nr:transportin-3-like [Adelges cooleyi]